MSDNSIERHNVPDAQMNDALSSVSVGDQTPSDTQLASVTALTETISNIRAAHRERNHWMEKRKRDDLSTGAFIRTNLGWSMALPAAERNRIRDHAADIFKEAERYVKMRRKLIEKARKDNKPVIVPEVPEIVRPLAHVLIPQIEMRKQVDDLEAVATKQMVTLAATLPVDPVWMEWAKGFGLLGLGIIIAETGDLSNYATTAKIWKRMGVAVIDGRRQGAPGPKATKEDWLKEGYSPPRRSRLAILGMAFIKYSDSPYRAVYLARKVYERQQAEAQGLIVAPSAQIPKNKKDEYRSLMHIDNRSRRYAEKRLLKHLWQHWKKNHA
jgi:hypothetical protein